MSYKRENFVEIVASLINKRNRNENRLSTWVDKFRYDGKDAYTWYSELEFDLNAKNVQQDGQKSITEAMRNNSFYRNA